MNSVDAPLASCKDESLEQRLQQIIGKQDLAGQRESVRQMAQKFDVDVLDCAAALLFLCQSSSAAASPAPAKTKQVAAAPQHRCVRYRLDVGSQHKVSKEQIQAVLVEESGVDKKRIARIDIRHNYTLVELPDGMPADIFQLLSEATIGGRKLAIKRVKANNRRRGRGEDRE